MPPQSVPLASTFVLSSKSGREAWVEPVVTGDTYRFTVRMGKPPEEARQGTKVSSRGANFRCLVSGAPITAAYVKECGLAGKMDAVLMAVVAEGVRGRVYLPPTQEQIKAAAQAQAQPAWKPSALMPDNPRWFSPPLYGLTTFGDLFTPRQLVALTTFSDLVQEAIAAAVYVVFSVRNPISHVDEALMQRFEEAFRFLRAFFYAQ